MIIRSLIAAAALVAASSVQAQVPACIPQREAESLFLALAPTLIGSVAATCATTLPSSALLRRAVGPLTAKYAAESDVAWPLAREGLRRLVGTDASPLIDSEFARPMVTAMVAPMLAKEVKAKDCPNIDRILTLIDPLPARNTAALIVAILDISGKAKGGGRERNPFILCPPDGATVTEPVDFTLPPALVELARRVIEENRAAGRRVATAESCTGGLVAAALTEIPGSSEVIDCGFVTYSNAAKATLLKVSTDVLETFGAVSVATAWQMAQGALAKSGADVAVAITGIAGPAGGSAKKPVGTVVFARAERGADPNKIVADERAFGDLGRGGIRLQAALCALELLLPGGGEA